MSPRLRIGLAACASLLSLAAAAQQGSPPTQGKPTETLGSVSVQGVSTAERERKTLSQFAQALADFERLKASWAPNAELRFKVMPRQRASDAERLQLALQTPQGPRPIEIDELQRFAWDPAWLDLPGDTEVRSLLRDGKAAWRPDVRTPGLPSNVRRLGDLRLQCKLSWTSGLARGLPPVLAVATAPVRWMMRAVTGQVGGDTECSGQLSGAYNSILLDKPVWAVALVDGPRRWPLPYVFLHGSGDATGNQAIAGSLDWPSHLRQHMIRLPLHDMSWSNETRVEIEYDDEQEQAR
ncbi:hypothetical protein [Pelomonas sp. SE-A7]|uniref:hypothetical protein n=1 Tax=Pelomonas sp. SE-A7 TaxID=3054953 RepID=UPI00259C916F|nr:hypothetical protein [Pelomonas sp. SE-A7]MDM4765908.1 hypothetical protein [Pelomonas sp. SE-A7]